MHKIGIPFLALVFSLVLTGVAHADSPHFLSANSSVNSSNSLVVSFKEVGLGNTVPTEHVTVSANATATYECINGGGNHPKAANKETVNGPVSGGGTFSVRNGSVTGTVTIAPPGPGAFSCPGGQNLVLASACFTDIVLTGAAGDTTTAPNVCSH